MPETAGISPALQRARAAKNAVTGAVKGAVTGAVKGLSYTLMPSFMPKINPTRKSNENKTKFDIFDDLHKLVNLHDTPDTTPDTTSVVNILLHPIGFREYKLYNLLDNDMYNKLYKSNEPQIDKQILNIIIENIKAILNNFIYVISVDIDNYPRHKNTNDKPNENDIDIIKSFEDKYLEILDNNLIFGFQNIIDNVISSLKLEILRYHNGNIRMLYCKNNPNTNNDWFFNTITTKNQNYIGLIGSIWNDDDDSAQNITNYYVNKSLMIIYNHIYFGVPLYLDIYIIDSEDSKQLTIDPIDNDVGQIMFVYTKEKFLFINYSYNSVLDGDRLNSYIQWFKTKNKIDASDDNIIKQIIFSNKISHATKYNINNYIHLFKGSVEPAIINNVDDYLPINFVNPFTASVNRVYLLNNDNIETSIIYRDNPNPPKKSWFRTPFRGGGRKTQKNKKIKKFKNFKKGKRVSQKIEKQLSRSKSHKRKKRTRRDRRDIQKTESRP